MMYNFIKRRLKKMGKTQKELAEFLNIAPPHLSAIFSGIRLIQATEIVPIANFLNIDIEDFARYIAGEIKDFEIKDKKNNEDFLTEEEKEIIQALRKVKSSNEVSSTTKAS